MIIFVNRFRFFVAEISTLYFFFLLFFRFYLILFLNVFDLAAAKNENAKYSNGKITSVRSENGTDSHRSVDLTVTCPVCIAKALEKPNCTDGESVFIVHIEQQQNKEWIFCVHQMNALTPISCHCRRKQERKYRVRRFAK